LTHHKTFKDIFWSTKKLLEGLRGAKNFSGGEEIVGRI